MISHRHRCVFVHIPKVAGQSIEHVFLGWNGLNWKGRAPLLLRPNEDPRKGPPRLAHLRAQDYVPDGAAVTSLKSSLAGAASYQPFHAP